MLFINLPASFTISRFIREGNAFELFRTLHVSMRLQISNHWVFRKCKNTIFIGLRKRQLVYFMKFFQEGFVDKYGVGVNKMIYFCTF